MNSDIFLGLVHNTALLLSLVVLFHIFQLDKTKHSILLEMIIGIIVGCIGITLMFTPWIFSEGVIFDTRSILISITGLFFGLVPTIILALMTIILRIYQGGGGALMGIFVIIASASLGLAWRYYLQRKNKIPRWYELYIFGIVVHVVMLACALFLPREIVFDVLNGIALPVMLIYPLGTVFLGLMIIRQQLRRKNEEALRESEERWQFALEGSRDGVWDWNIKTGVVFFSPRWKEMLGYSQNEILNQVDEWKRLIHPDDMDLVYAALNKHLSDKTPFYTTEYRILNKDGSYKWILDRGKVIQWSEDKKPLRMIGTHTDISERKKAEQDLIAAKENAEASDRLKTAFINNISHEIRTPLNGIIGFGQLMARNNMSEQEKLQYFNILESSTNRLVQTITDFVDISLIESGTIVANKTTFPVDLLMAEMLEFTKQRCAGSDVTVTLEMAEKYAGMQVNTDIELLKKALKHLLDNAAKFTRQGSITAGLKRKNEHWEFFVKDTGEGIAENALQHIFETFQQEEASSTRGYEGSGLGLSIVKGIIGLLGGKVWVESEKGKGTTFFFTLPADGFQLQPDLNLIPLRDDLKKDKPVVLVAEDDDSNYLYTKIVLVKSGFLILRAKNGEEAVEMCRQHPEIDLVLMDIKMPVMDGMEATRKIKEFRKEIPVIALTAYAQSGDEFRILEAGCDSYLSKPVKRELLLERMEKFGLFPDMAV
jgi:PAS domain S-box-containing protein